MRALDDGALEGPRIYSSGACLGQTSGHGDWRWNGNVINQNGNVSNLELLSTTRLTDDADEVLKACRNNLAAGAVFCKRPYAEEQIHLAVGKSVVARASAHPAAVVGLPAARG